MATRKSTTKAKTKTTKRTVKSAATRASKSSTKSKVVTKKSVTKQPARRELFTLRNLHIAGAILLLGLAVAAGLLMQPLSYALTTTHLTNDTFLAKDQTVFVPAVRALFDMDIRWLVTGLLVLSAALPILYLTRLKDYYANRLTTGRVLGLRWVEAAVTSALMLEIVAILAGYTDIMTLKMIGGLAALTAGLGWLAEKQNDGANQPVHSAFGLSIFSGVLPWVVIATAMAHTVLYGAVRSPWYVYAAAAALLAGFLLQAINLRGSFGNSKNYETVERNYVLNNLLLKTAFALILVVGLLK